MKRSLVLVGAALTLVAGSAFAGENCIYGQKQANLASADSALENANQETDPKLLALIKQQEEKGEALFREQPIVHN